MSFDSKKRKSEKGAVVKEKVKNIAFIYKKIKKRENEEIKLLLDMRVIPFAMQTCGYSFDRNLLNKVFGGSRSFIKKGSKSAKKLRDGIVHAMNEDDLKEMMARSEELFSAMDNYLSIMKNS